MDQIKKEVVYIDTSVPSAYYDDRVLWRMEYTRKWWHEELVRYHAVISPAVIAEILGQEMNRQKRNCPDWFLIILSLNFYRRLKKSLKVISDRK